MASRIDPAVESDQRSGADRRSGEGPLPAFLKGEERRRADRRARG